MQKCVQNTKMHLLGLQFYDRCCLTTAPSIPHLADPAVDRLCAKCGRHPATVRWVGEGGFLAFTHGMYEWWCRCCADREQLNYARKMARRIPRLQKDLAKARRTCGN